MTKPTQTQPKKINRSAAGLRDAIFDEIDAMRDGTSNPTRANAVAKLASGVVETVRMELEVHRALKDATPPAAGNGNGKRIVGEDMSLSQPLPLGAR